MQSNKFDDYSVQDLLNLISAKYYAAEYGSEETHDFISSSFDELLSELKDRLENTAI